ncbi:MAG: hypothetical protein ABI645_14360 [Pseudomonadota bacterium]
MRIKYGTLLACIGVVAASLSLSGCGADSVASNALPDPGPADPAPAQIEGVATPSGVAVVTATNAN